MTEPPAEAVITKFLWEPSHTAPGAVALAEFLRYLIGKSKRA
ncbi:hypothetical protein [Rhizobium sp. 1399]|nr:hypothetical protein [Rhizobium sp. 1399]MDR6671188.1 hypothetical protein [Rhizobium sp. 1399]